jgi:uncharacterized protein (DUF1800 family)
MAVSVEDIAHLLRRTTYACTTAQAQAALAAYASHPDGPLAGIVDELLGPDAAPPPMSDPLWLTKDYGVPEAEVFTKWVEDGRKWWFDTMADTTAPLRDKMLFFWHGHFATEVNVVMSRSWHWSFLKVLHQHALGDFRVLVKKMSVEPLMLRYLDNYLNVKTGPNENFGRELLELFMLGVDRYTQTEVAEVSRAWTGHTIVSNAYAFVPAKHDTGMKTIFGVTQNFDGPDVVDLICDHPVKRVEMGEFIVGRLWAHFAGAALPTAVRDALVTVFLQRLNIRDLLRAMFLDPAFYSVDVRTGLVRTPVDFVVAVMRLTGLNSVTGIQPSRNTTTMGQALFQPPNVAGWGSNTYWLGETMMAARANWAGFVAKYLADRTPLFIDPAPVADVNAAATQIFAKIGIANPAPASLASVVDWLTEARAKNWNQRHALYLALMSPDFQLA